MAATDNITQLLSPDTQGMFRVLWDSLSPAEQKSVQNLISGVPSDANMVRLLIRLSTSQLRLTFGQKKRVAIVGPANVGKSTLYNQLISSRQDQALVSPIPGTTRINQTADAGIFAVIDTPGADAVGDVGEKEKLEAMQAAQGADFLIIVFDAIQGIKKGELELYEDLLALGKPYIIVLNKIDLVAKSASQVVKKAAANLRVEEDRIIPVVATKGKNLDKILVGIAVQEPGIIVALGKALPQYRWKLSWRNIVSATSISAVIALSPLPVIDFVPLVMTQSAMVLGIARIHNYEITLKRAKELIATFGLGLIGRSLFQQLSKLGGLPGWLLSAAIAASTTMVMGYAATVWFQRGERISQDSLKSLTKEMTQYFINLLRTFTGNKPSKESILKHIEESLENSPLSEELEAFENYAAKSQVSNEIER